MWKVINLKKNIFLVTTLLLNEALTDFIKEETEQEEKYHATSLLIFAYCVNVGQFLY